jgi:hypothetical protein
VGEPIAAIRCGPALCRRFTSFMMQRRIWRARQCMFNADGRELKRPIG